MASPYIAGSTTSGTVYQRIRSNLTRLRDAVDALEDLRNLIDAGLRNQDGTTAVNYAPYATESTIAAGGYADANTAAKASYDELASLVGKLTTDASVSNVFSALNQACAKHGV